LRGVPKAKNRQTQREKKVNPTVIVLRNHFIRRNLNLSTTPNATIQGSKIKTDLLLLKNGVNPNQEDYVPSQVKMIIEARNHGAAAKTLKTGKQQDPNRALRLKFNELEATTSVRNLLWWFFLKRCFRPRTL